MSTSPAVITSAASEHLWSMMSSQAKLARSGRRDRLAALTFTGQPSPPGHEVAGVRRRLVFARRQQIAIAGEEVEFLTDHDVIVVLAALILRPEDFALAPERL